MNKTQIEWVKNPDGTQGYTYNPITGCLNGCPYCYARKLANGRLKSRYLANKNFCTVTPEGYDNYPNLDPFYPRFWPEKLSQIINPVSLQGKTRAKSKGIFICDMSDLFGIGVPEEWTRRVMATIEICPQHRFYLLTKQPQNLPKWSPFPENAWVGQTITQNLDGIGYMADIQAKLKFISFEPLLYYDVDPLTASEMFRVNGIDWLIIGAQTKPYKPPRIEWVQEIVEAADRAGIPVFLKDNLESLLKEAKFTFAHNLFWRNGYYTDITNPAVDLHLRQEIPSGD